MLIWAAPIPLISKCFTNTLKSGLFKIPSQDFSYVSQFLKGPVNNCPV